MSALWSAWGADAFTEQVEKATSELLPVGSEDMALNLEICDQVRAKQVPAKQAMQVLKRRLSHRNPNVVLLALGLTDICIKNGGDHFLQQVASREFMDNLVSLLRNPAGVNNDVKAKALGLIQNWSQIAQAKPAHMSYITDIYNQLKLDSKFDFPPLDPNLAASAALVETLTAPEWVDGDVCMRCRTAFTTFNRKHHCRNCGNVFCQQCSSHNMALPWFGIGQDVRVCDGCYARKRPPNNAVELSRSKSAGEPSTTKHVPSGRSASSSHHRSATSGAKSRRSARQKEEQDMALAIKLSLEGAPQASRPESYATPSQPSAAPSNAHKAAPNGRVLEGTDADDDPDLAAAIAASLRDWAPPQPSAPDGLVDPSGAAPASGASMHGTDSAHSNLPLPPSLDLAPQDVDNILTFSQTIRAQQAHNQATGTVGAPVPPPVQALYEKASSARPRMARNLDEGHRRHNVLVSMHDKLTEAVRLYDRLLDAQMTRPAQAYASNGYAQPSYPAATHLGYGYGYEQAAPSLLYPQAPQAHAAPNAEYSGAPFHAQWHPQQQNQQHQQHQPQHDHHQHAYQHAYQQQHSEPYGLQPPPQSQYAPHEPQHPNQQQHHQQQQQQQQHQQQQYAGPNAMSSYPNGAYADPNAAAVSPGPTAAAPAQYASYEYAGAPMDHASHAHPHANVATPAAGGAPVASHGIGALSIRTDGIMGGSPSHVSATPVDKIGAADEGQGDESIATSRLSGDTSISSRNGWNTVPIQAVAPLSQPESSAQHGAQEIRQQQQQQQQQQQPSQPQQYHDEQRAQQQRQQPPAKADTSYLPLFPVAPHADNGFGGERHAAEAASPVASPYTNAPSSAGMWQSSAGKSGAGVNAAATESPLIEF